MPTFRYSAYRNSGSPASGTIEADSPRDAQLRLKRDGLFPREIEPVAGPLAGGLRLFRTGRVPLPELALLTRRLATLEGAAVPVYEAISALATQERPGELQKTLHRLRERLAEGQSLAGAMALEPAIFNESYVAMVAAGESSGSLDVVLESLADFLEGQDATRSRIITSLAYPILMTVVGSAVMLFLLAFVVPKIVVIFEDNRAALPLLTRGLMAVSGFLNHWWWAALLITGLAWAVGRRLLRREGARRWRDRLLLRLPLVGPLRQRLFLARFGRILGLLLTSGVPMVRALEITGPAVVNREYRAALERLKEELIGGGSLSAALGRSPLFPPLLVHMVMVGEKGGELEAMLVKAGSAYEREFDTGVSRLMALLEPLLVLGMGLAVGLVVIAVLLPIFELNQLIR